MSAASVGFQCPECVKQGNASVRQARTIYGGRARGGAGADIVTRALIGINVLVFIATTADGNNFFSGSGNSRIFEHLALIPPAVAHGEWWRLFTAAFLHFGLLHIAFNMYALFLFGPILERDLGRLRFITLYLLAGVGGSLLSVALGPLNETAAGASGAIFGLMGALYVVFRHRNVDTNSVAITIAANLVFTFAIANIDWRGHVGGLITGGAIAYLLTHVPHGPMRARMQAAGVAAVCVVLAAAGLLAVHRVDSGCKHAVNAAISSRGLGNVQDAAYCAHYDPASVPSQ